MSRTRIVKGKHTKSIGENYNISAEGNIFCSALLEVVENGITDGVVYDCYERIGSDISDDFEIRFSLRKESSYSSFVPLGVLDFEGNYENPNFVFDYSLMLGNIDSLEFKVLNEDGTTLYAITNLPEIVVTARRLPLLKKELEEKKPKYDPQKPIKTWDWKSIVDSYIFPDYTKIGSYCIFWDGFDYNDVYDSAKFNNKKLTAIITARKNGLEKTAEVEFTTQYKEVDWVDVKIDRKNKKIDTTLRVNLKDGGANGISCVETISSFEPASSIRICPWESIPKNALIPGKPPITVRTKNFADLEKLAIDGLSYHWGRNSNHSIAKDVKIVGEPFEFYLNPINTENNSMDDINLIYNTNDSWKRSGNPGSATMNPISWIGNAVSREAICYNVGYIKTSRWRYREENTETIDFKFTSAHEIGHEILKSYGGTIYSYGHKGSVNFVTQSMKDSAPSIPSSGEVDIMPYYPNDLPYSMYNRYVAAEKDVLGLIWLTKLKIQ